MCYIINDLLNRELIRRKFTFEYPGFHKLNHILEEDNPEIVGSNIFDLDEIARQGE